MKSNLAMPALLPHHAASVAAFLNKTRSDDSIVAVLLGGSLVKGTYRRDSDVDLMIVLTADAFADRQAHSKLAECLYDGITYEKGYYDVKYVTREILELTAVRGSEPARNAFVGARVVQSSDSCMADLVASISCYPEHERSEKIAAFHAGLVFSTGYFWSEARKRGDSYLLMRSATDAVMYGLRMVLGYNRILFPCQRWLTKAVGDCAETPPNILALAETLLTTLGDDERTAFREAILQWRDWEITGDVQSRYVRDHELWWQWNGPFVNEW